MDNKELLKKTDLALADLASGGLLETEQSDTFIRKLINTPTILNQNTIRFVPMRSPTMKVEKIVFGKRVLRAATEATALATAAVDGAFNASTEATARAKPQFSTVNLSAKEVIAEIRMTYSTMEDNIERAAAANNEATNDGPGGLRTTILEILAERASLDLEELGLLGDTSLGATDPYLDLVDGWLVNASANGNVVAVGGATVSKAMFKAGLKAMPSQYKRRPADLVNFVSNNNELEYRDTLADRVGALGDGMTTGQMTAMAYGTSVQGNAIIGDTNGIMTNPKNLIFGIHRDVSLEFDKNIQTREYIIVLTARVDFATEEDEAIVYYDNIGAA